MAHLCHNHPQHLCHNHTFHNHAPHLCHPGPPVGTSLPANSLVSHQPRPVSGSVPLHMLFLLLETFFPPSLRLPDAQLPLCISSAIGTGGLSRPTELGCTPSLRPRPHSASCFSPEMSSPVSLEGTWAAPPVSWGSSGRRHSGNACPVAPHLIQEEGGHGEGGDLPQIPVSSSPGLVTNRSATPEPLPSRLLGAEWGSREWHSQRSARCCIYSTRGLQLPASLHTPVH